MARKQASWRSDFNSKVSWCWGKRRPQAQRNVGHDTHHVLGHQRRRADQRHFQTVGWPNGRGDLLAYSSWRLTLRPHHGHQLTGKHLVDLGRVYLYALGEYSGLHFTENSG